MRRLGLSPIVLTMVLAMLPLAVGGSTVRPRRSLQKGITYVTWWPGGYSRPEVSDSLVDLASTGAGWISVIVTGYQDGISGTSIGTTSDTPTDDDLAHVISRAHELGLKVMLKPHVNLLDDPAHWRGQIGKDFSTDAEWEEWFDAYEAFVEHYAELAERHEVDQFCVGTELGTTVHRVEDWRALIAGVRARYGGPITYAANHSGEEVGITWWDAVDYIGVDAYYPLTDEYDPTLDELREAWTPIVTALARLSAEWDRPILLTEIGYCSVDGANRSPWDCWLNGGPSDLQEQADCYEAAFESLFNQPWFAGMFWWEWITDPTVGGPDDANYTPRGKPAEDILLVWYGTEQRTAVPAR